MLGDDFDKKISANELFLKDDLASSNEILGKKLSENSKGYHSLNYTASLCQFFSGNLIYGQKNSGGTTVYVYEIFV